MDQKGRGGALGAEEALEKSVREAAENTGRAEREQEAGNLTEATHGVRTDDGEPAEPPVKGSGG
jgi:hypothetical protein